MADSYYIQGKVTTNNGWEIVPTPSVLIYSPDVPPTVYAAFTRNDGTYVSPNVGAPGLYKLVVDAIGLVGKTVDVTVVNQGPLTTIVQDVDLGPFLEETSFLYTTPALNSQKAGTQVKIFATRSVWQYYRFLIDGVVVRDWELCMPYNTADVYMWNTTGLPPKNYYPEVQFKAYGSTNEYDFKKRLIGEWFKIR